MFLYLSFFITFFTTAISCLIFDLYIIKYKQLKEKKAKKTNVRVCVVSIF